MTPLLFLGYVAETVGLLYAAHRITDYCASRYNGRLWRRLQDAGK